MHLGHNIEYPVLSKGSPLYSSLQKVVPFTTPPVSTVIINDGRFQIGRLGTS